MSDNHEIELERDCEAIQIPAGLKTTIPAGTKVIITQSLGGSYTIACDYGLFRISEENAGCPWSRTAQLAGERLKKAENRWTRRKSGTNSARSTIPKFQSTLWISVWFTIARWWLRFRRGTKVEVKMTLTAPGCGMGPAIAQDARSKILTIPGVDEADVELVWDPPWNQHMISEAGKMKLGLI